MHAVPAPPPELVVSQENFDVIPGWLIAFVASVLLLRLLRRYGHKITPQESKVGDLLLDIAVLLTAGSIVASISTTPLVSTLVASINRNISEWVVNDIRFGDIAIAGVVLVTLIITVLLAFLYTKSENGRTLILFGLSLQVMALFAPWINTTLAWWINYIVAAVWNFILGVITAIPNAEIHF